MSFYTLMEKRGVNEFRFDTRIYLGDNAIPTEDDQMIAAIVGKNPGKAKPNICNELVPFNGGNLLKIARNRFLEGFKEAGICPPSNAYIQAWNLFYLRDEKLKVAKRVMKELRESGELTTCPSERSIPPIVWFAWGRPKKIERGELAHRFLDLNISHPFYFCMDKKEVVTGMPTLDDGAKHTQGMPRKPIVVHLAKTLASL